MTRREALAKTAVSLVIGGVCLWLAAAKVDLSEVGSALRAFDPRYLVAAVALSIAIQLLRALRWQLELSPLATLGYPLVWQVVSVAYMMINVLPFRLGEPVRPVLMSWKSGLGIPAIVGNWVFEKMLDTAALVLFIHITLVVADLPAWAHTASATSLTALLVLFSIVVGFWLRGERFYKATLGHVLPAALGDRVRRPPPSPRAACTGLRQVPQPTASDPLLQA